MSKRNKGGKKATQHFCVGAKCTRKGKVVTQELLGDKQFPSISQAKHFMRTGQ